MRGDRCPRHMQGMMLVTARVPTAALLTLLIVSSCSLPNDEKVAISAPPPKDTEPLQTNPARVEATHVEPQFKRCVAATKSLSQRRAKYSTCLPENVSYSFVVITTGLPYATIFRQGSRRVLH